MSQRIRSSFRSCDILGRIGGDEFVVFMKNTHRQYVEKKASILCQSLCMDVTNNQETVHVSATIGIALYPYDGFNFMQLYQHADEALYHIKKDGKNNFKFFSE